jgi:cytochrome c oxidase subunit IV
MKRFRLRDYFDHYEMEDLMGWVYVLVVVVVSSGLLIAGFESLRP